MGKVITMAADQSKQKNRQEIQDSVDITHEETPQLWVWKNRGQKISGTVDAARTIPTEFQGEIQRDAKGSPKKHLRVLIRNDSGLHVVDLNSENAKDAYRKGLENAGYSGLAQGDNFSMEYTHDDAPLSDRVNGARAFEIVIS